mmetsp:Transcript_4050/g.4176  ORF Transcript_4050/g.4176 Transcript_4050/m.4176 type:complete len:338 (+) Transcript_4050:151-1164(+)
MAKMTYDKKLFDMNSWVKLSTNLGARDKLVKIIQYFARILLWYYRKIDIDESSLRALCEIKSVTSLSRRSFRFLRSVNHINRISKAATDIIENNHSSLEDLLISCVGILDDFLLIMYFGYENYLFFVSAKILRIKGESESALRNSSSVVSMIGNFSRILGVCLRINRSFHVSERKKEKLAFFLEMNSSYEMELNQSSGALAIQQPQLAIEQNNKQKQENETIITQLQRHAEGTQEEEQQCKEVINLHHDNKILMYLKERERLEMDYCVARNERSALHLDAFVVTLELIISANYKPFCFWHRLFNYSIINEGHEGVVGLISSFYALHNMWPITASKNS